MLALRVLFLLAGSILGAFYPFLSAILADRGFGPAEIGLTAALASLAFMLAVPVWGHLADVVIGRTAALRAGIIGSTAALLGLLLSDPPIIVVGLIVTYAAFESSIAPLTDALAVNALSRSPQSYARVRLLTSFGFAGTSILAGALYNVTGFWPAPLLVLVSGIGMVVALRWVSDVARFRSSGVTDATHVSIVARRGGSFLMVLRAQPRFRGVLLGLGLVHVGILAGFTFLALRLLELGGQPSDVALSAGISALAEIPAMALIPRIVRRTGTRALLASGMILYAAVLVSWAFLADPSLIVATRLLSGLAFAAITIAAVMTVATLLPAELQATGQGLYQTVGFGASAVVANALGGVVFGLGGAMPLFLGCAVLALGGAAVIWKAAEVTPHGGLAAAGPGVAR
ncbi:MAG: MFS transporter [Chloroflexota bacterium]